MALITDCFLFLVNKWNLLLQPNRIHVLKDNLQWNFANKNEKKKQNMKNADGRSQQNSNLIPPVMSPETCAHEGIMVGWILSWLKMFYIKLVKI